MKILHTSDLHLGKNFKGFSLIEEQKHILNEILNIILKEKVNCLVVSGDIYDTSIASISAINLFDEFLSNLAKNNIKSIFTSGNHDNNSRLSFGSEIISKQNIYFSKKYSGKIEYVDLDENVRIYYLPFIRPFEIREFFKEEEITSFQKMMEVVLKNEKLDKEKTNIISIHQFITKNGKSPDMSESEEQTLGTLENIDYSVFKDFFYVALGHIHKPQAMGRTNVRYSGSPLKYSFSEINDKKSVTIVEVKDGKLSLDTIELKPLRDLKIVRGKFDEILKMEKSSDYTKIILEDENFITDAKNRLQETFSNIAQIEYDNNFTRENKIIDTIKKIENKTPMELFEEFFELQSNRKMEKEEQNIVKKAINVANGEAKGKES